MNQTSTTSHSPEPAAYVDAYIGLGSNLANPRAQLDAALGALTALPQTDFVACSAFYRSAPMGPQDQPDFVNAVARVRTALQPSVLLAQLHLIEQQHGRERLVHWGPRTLDLDLLLYAEQTIDTPDLQVPHPGIAQRSFVLLPLRDLVEELMIPNVGWLSECLARIDCQDLKRL